MITSKRENNKIIKGTSKKVILKSKHNIDKNVRKAFKELDETLGLDKAFKSSGFTLTIKEVSSYKDILIKKHVYKCIEELRKSKQYDIKGEPSIVIIRDKDNVYAKVENKNSSMPNIYITMAEKSTLQDAFKGAISGLKSVFNK